MKTHFFLLKTFNIFLSFSIRTSIFICQNECLFLSTFLSRHSLEWNDILGTSIRDTLFFWILNILSIQNINNNFFFQIEMFRTWNMNIILYVYFLIGRIAMSMTTLLTLIAMFSSVRQNVPKVSYVSYLDIWMVVCIFFVFYCIVEFVIVTVMVRNQFKRAAKILEYTSRATVPFVFIFFNIVYWPMLYFED